MGGVRAPAGAPRRAAPRVSAARQHDRPRWWLLAVVCVAMPPPVATCQGYLTPMHSYIIGSTIFIVGSAIESVVVFQASGMIMMPWQCHSLGPSSSECECSKSRPKAA